MYILLYQVAPKATNQNGEPSKEAKQQAKPRKATDKVTLSRVLLYT